MEWRKTVRYSIAKKSINMLLPKFYDKAQVISEYHKLKNWCFKEFKKNPSLLERFKTKEYLDKHSIEIFQQAFILRIKKEPRKTCSAHINKQKEVIVKCPDDIAFGDQNRLIGMVLSRVFSNFFIKDIKERVMHYNRLYFNEEIDNIKLKNNQSNWGSCSTKRNINLSSRLLFAPMDVLDYVIIHELAHLKEMNHSPRFWNIVRKVMPDYLEKEAWLDKHGNSLKF